MARLKENDRVCPLCTNGLIENELHFLFICNSYTHKRIILFRTLQNRNFSVDISSEIQQVHLLKVLSDVHPKLLARYIIDCMNIRQTKMYVSETYNR